MVWKPHVTVAAVIENDGKFLMVEEIADQLAVYNQPAGHLEDNESFVNAIIREVQEETAWQFIPEAITGIYRWRKDDEDKTFVRVCFTGTLGKHLPSQPLDDGIITADWLTHEEILSLPDSRLRSPMVKKCIENYLSGHRYSMEMLHEMENI